MKKMNDYKQTRISLNNIISYATYKTSGLSIDGSRVSNIIEIKYERGTVLELDYTEPSFADSDLKFLDVHVNSVRG